MSKVLARFTGQTILSTCHSCPSSVAKGLRAVSILSRVRGDVSPEREIHVGNGQDSRDFREVLRDYKFCMSYEAMY